MLQGTVPLRTLTWAQTEAVVDMLDRLRENGIDKDVVLPDVKAVGDTGAGKSLILERIAGVPLLSAPCVETRFATVVSMRPTKEECVGFPNSDNRRRTTKLRARGQVFCRILQNLSRGRSSHE